MSSSMSLVRADLPRAVASASARSAASSALAAFSADLFGSVTGSGAANVVCSPYSVAMALGMTVQGARGTTARQMLEVLHARDAATLAGGLNAVDQALAARSGPVPDPARPGRTEQLVLTTANSLWGQRGEPWRQAFLDVLARDFGTGVRQVDYRQAEAARAAINTWVSQRTQARIPHLIPPGLLDAGTRMTLVNAVYLKASWAAEFDPQLTGKAPFHRLDGSSVTVDLMSGDSTGQRYATGPGWSAACLPYAKGQLAMTVVVPEAGRFAEVRAALAGDGLARLLAGLRTGPVHVGLPKWTTRTQVDLTGALGALGMPAAFGAAADFSGMTTADALTLAAVVHEGFIKVDEAGTEAAAASAAVAEVMSLAAPPPRRVLADRPFLYVVHDLPTGTPLFVGQVVDPTA
jgi:serpin B